MSGREQPRERALTGLIIIFFLLLVWAGGWVMWYRPVQVGKERLDGSGLNLSQSPNLDKNSSRSAPEPGIIVPEAGPAWVKAPPRAAKPAAASRAERPEWKTAALSFVRLANAPRYRRSRVLRLWAEDFAAYPDLRALGAIYARNKDLKFFAASVLRSTNFAKMLRKYGTTDDVKNFLIDLAAAPGVAEASRALIEDPQVFESVKDLRLPGLPPLGEMMTSGARGSAPPSDNEALEQYLRATSPRANP